MLIEQASPYLGGVGASPRMTSINTKKHPRDGGLVKGVFWCRFYFQGWKVRLALKKLLPGVLWNSED